MRGLLNNNDEIGMFGPETDLIISLAAILILFITVEKKRNNDDLRSVKDKQIEVMKGIWNMIPPNKDRVSVVSLEKDNTFLFEVYNKQKYQVGAINVENYDYRQKIILGEAVLFEPGAYILKDRGKILLSEVFNNKGFQNNIDFIEEIRIDGHADVTQTKNKRFEFGNTELASLRAIQVFTYFKEQKIFNPEKILMSASSYAEYNPVDRVTQKGQDRTIDRSTKLSDYNDTSDKQKQNRRIEIVITYSPKDLSLKGSKVK